MNKKDYEVSLFKFILLNKFLCICLYFLFHLKKKICCVKSTISWSIICYFPTGLAIFIFYIQPPTRPVFSWPFFLRYIIHLSHYIFQVNNDTLFRTSFLSSLKISKIKSGITFFFLTIF